MQEHPVPRQITSFEFKLIGELTIKQFGYLAFGVCSAVLLFFMLPKILYLNFLGAAIPALLGIGLAFVPVNERPMDIWLKNLLKRLMSPTQYYYRKNNQPPKILLGLQLPPREVLLQHVKAQQSLNEYLQKKPKTDARDAADALDETLAQKKKNIQSLFSNSGSVPGVSIPNAPIAVPVMANNIPLSVPQAPIAPVIPQPQVMPVSPPLAMASAPVPSPPPPPPPPATPTTITFNGQVLTAQGVPLANMMVYIRRGAETVRLFKTDPSGFFQNSLPLEKSDYLLEVEDPQKKYTFARMKLDGNIPSLQIFAQA